MAYQPRMYIHFDHNKVVLPPILGGPQPPVAPTLGKKRRQHEVNYEFAPTIHFPDFEKALDRASQNELNYGARQANGHGDAESSKKMKMYHEPTPKDQVRSFQQKTELIQALGTVFRASSDVNFAGIYRVHEPGVTHQQRIKSLTHEIWEVTGYRFTIKDHPPMKGGHKTRLWCSQDEAHKLKPSKTSQKPRTLGDGVLMAKARYPCRSGLLISSREEGEDGASLITIRIHHHVAHEPYYDNTLPPEITQAIWANICRERKITPSPMPSLETIVKEQEDEADHIRPPGPGELWVPPTPPMQALPPQMTAEAYHQRMRRHISAIRNFCDGLEYRLPFNDFGLLETLESEGAQFLRLVSDWEGQLKREGSNIAVGAPMKGTTSNSRTA